MIFGWLTSSTWWFSTNRSQIVRWPVSDQEAAEGEWRDAKLLGRRGWITITRNRMGVLMGSSGIQWWCIYIYVYVYIYIIYIYIVYILYRYILQLVATLQLWTFLGLARGFHRYRDVWEICTLVQHVYIADVEKPPFGDHLPSEKPWVFHLFLSAVYLRVFTTFSKHSFDSTL